MTFEEIINSGKPVLVDFFATWCGPCHAQTPILEDLKKRIGEKASIIKIDVDKNRELAGKYNIMSIPTICIFYNGELVYRQPGVHQATQLESLLFDAMGR